jgi:hypothetical protein
MLVAAHANARCAACPLQILGEPLGAEVAARGARRMSRLEGIIHHLGIGCGRLAAVLARRLILPVGKDTLPRVVGRRARLAGTAPVQLSASTTSPGNGASATARLCVTWSGGG